MSPSSMSKRADTNSIRKAWHLKNIQIVWQVVVKIVGSYKTYISGWQSTSLILETIFTWHSAWELMSKKGCLRRVLPNSYGFFGGARFSRSGWYRRIPAYAARCVSVQGGGGGGCMTGPRSRPNPPGFMDSSVTMGRFPAGWGPTKFPK